MMLRERAERILFGERLADKLTPLEGAPDDDRGRPIAAPRLPGRGVEIPVRPRAKQDVRFPAGLGGPLARGLALVHFAGHELLALELMALGLLRFPDADPRFRSSLARAMHDEQQHLRAYLARAEALGVGFPDVSPSDFFWRAVSGVESPLALVAALCLTLEQANLDFAIDYAARFRDSDDPESAALLERVHQDELRHVQNGVLWFRRWKDPGRSDFEAHAAALSAPLSLARAKGRIFSRESRRQVGLDEDYIERLSVFERSKGRVPDVYWFNPGIEMELAGEAKSAIARTIAADLAPAFGILAKDGDVVLTGRIPGVEHLRARAELGFSRPEWVVADGEGLPPALAGRRLGAIVAFGDGPAIAAAEGRSFTARAPYEKSWGQLRLAELSTPEEAERSPPGEVVHTVEGVERALARRPLHRFVIKATLSAAGRARVFAVGTLDDAGRAWCANTLARQGALVVEPWFDRVLDLSVVGDATPGRLLRGLMEQLVDERGRYRGHVFGKVRWPPGLERPEARLSAALAHVAEAAAKEGHVGPIGLDACVHRALDDPTRLVLRPIVEVNPRHTMGHVALALSSRVARRAAAVWIHLLAREVGSFVELSRRWAAELPVERDARGLLVRGAVFTADPDQAEIVLPVLLVDADLSAIEARLSAVMADPPRLAAPAELALSGRAPPA